MSLRPTSVTSMLAAAGLSTVSTTQVNTVKPDVADNDPAVQEVITRSLFKFDADRAKIATDPNTIVYEARIVMVRPATQLQLASIGSPKGDFSVLRIADIDFTTEIPRLNADGSDMTDEEGKPVLINPSIHWHVSKPLPTAKAKQLRSWFLDIVRNTTGRWAISKASWDRAGFEPEVNRTSLTAGDDILNTL